MRQALAARSSLTPLVDFRGVLTSRRLNVCVGLNQQRALVDLSPTAAGVGLPERSGFIAQCLVTRVTVRPSKGGALVRLGHFTNQKFSCGAMRFAAASRSFTLNSADMQIQSTTSATTA